MIYSGSITFFFDFDIDSDGPTLTIFDLDSAPMDGGSHEFP